MNGGHYVNKVAENSEELLVNNTQSVSRMTLSKMLTGLANHILDHNFTTLETNAKKLRIHFKPQLEHCAETGRLDEGPVALSLN